MVFNITVKNISFISRSTGIDGEKKMPVRCVGSKEAIQWLYAFFVKKWQKDPRAIVLLKYYQKGVIYHRCVQNKLGKILCNLDKVHVGVVDYTN